MDRSLLFPLAIVLLLLPLPGVSAEGGIELDVQGAGHVSTAVATSTQPDLGTSYGLTLSSARELVLVSQVTGPAGEHQASWSIDGTSIGLSNATDSLAAPQFGAGQHSVTVGWRLPASAPAGTYTLRILVRELPSGSEGAVGTTSGDTADVVLQLSRSAATAGSAGGALVAGSLSAVTVTRTEVELTWPATAGAAGYLVHRSLDPGFAPGASSQVAAPSGTSYLDRGLQPGTMYHYRLQAIDGSSMAGPASPLLSVRTLAAPDTSPPGSKPVVQVGQVTSTSVGLGWTPVADAAALSYEVFRIDGQGQERRVASTANTFATDAGLQAGTTYTYRVRAVDASGNAGPLSDAVSAVTSAAAAPDSLAPTIRAIVFRHSGGNLVATWEADESGQGSIAVTQGAQTRTVGGGQGVAFRADLGPIEGALDYSIVVQDAAGNRGTLGGRLGAEDAAASHRAPAALAAATSLILASSADLYFVDRDGDGRFDAVTSGDGTVDTLHAAPSVDLFVVERGDDLAVLRPRAEQAFEAELVEGRVVDTTESGAIRRVTLSVSGSGWGVVDLPDAYLGLPIVSIRRTDGTDVDLSQSWREDGRIRFVDDLDSGYVLLLDTGVAQTGTNLEEADPSGDGMPSWVLPVGVGAAVLVGLALGLLLRRRR